MTDSKIKDEIKKLEGMLFQAGSAGLHMVMPNGKHIAFGNKLKYRTSDPDEIAYLKAEADTKSGVVKIPEDQSQDIEPPKAPGTDTELRTQQLREFLAKSKPLEIQDSEVKSTLNPIASSDSPLTGGTNPASPRFSQAETIAALKGAKIVKD